MAKTGKYFRLSEQAVQMLEQRDRLKYPHEVESRYRNGEINLSAYLRKCLLRGGYGWMEEAYRKELRELSYQVRKIGVNINQVVRQLNSGYQSRYAVKELIDLMKEMGKRFEKTQERFQQIDGGDIAPST